MKTQRQGATRKHTNVIKSGADDLVTLEHRILALKEVADQIDPYSPLTISMQEKLIELDIEISHDPFRLTNQILKTMEDALETREKIRQELGLGDEPDHLFSSTLPTKH